MGYRIIEPVEAEQKHECDLPYRDGGYVSTGLPDFTVVQCDQCQTFWFAAPCYASYGPVQKWRKVRWYHFLLRRRHGLTLEPVGF